MKPVRLLLPPLLLGAVLLSGCPAQPEILISGGEGYAEGALQTYPGLAGVPNIDDDNDDGDVDWDERGEAEGDDERSVFYVEAEAWQGVKKNESMQLELSGQVERVRVYRGDTQILGETDGDTLLVAPLSAADDTMSFTVEFREALVSAAVTLRLLDKNGESKDSDTAWMTASPLILNQHLQPSEHTWVLNVPSGVYAGDYQNDQMIDDFEDVLGDDFTGFDGGPYDYDVWIQDEWQFAAYSALDQRLDVVIDSIRNRPADPWPEDNYGDEDNWLVETWGSPPANSHDSFGNLEVSPPLTDSDGVGYPLGRIYWGGDNGLHPDVGLTDFLASQLIQSPVRIDTTWLCVGHVDEFLSFVADPTAPRGFRFVYNDTDAAWDIMDEMDPGTPLHRYSLPAPWDGHEMDNVGEIQTGAVVALNEEIQEDILDPILEQLVEDFGLTEEEILRMPGIFEEPQGCGGYVAALIPGMVNFFPVNVGDTQHLFLADPFFRNVDDSHEGQDEDPMIAAVEDMMPSNVELHFVDNWSVYHMGLGEVHCGTNGTQTPVDWWNRDVAHLMQGEEE
jgi:hypothetical protein